MLYIPWEMAYGEQEGRQSLCFEIELIARGKKGELVKADRTCSCFIGVGLWEFFSARATPNPNFGQKLANFGWEKSQKILICLFFDHF